MAHFPKPFFKAARGLWYVEIDRKQHNLGPDKDHAFERYHELMRHQPGEADCSLAIGVLDAFLGWAKNNKAPRTFEWYQRHCTMFAKSLPSRLSVGQLKKHHLTACLESHAELNSTTKNGLCRAVCRAFRWAENEDLIIRSPLRGVTKPQAKQRTVVVSADEYANMLAVFQAEEIRLLLEIAWETAARPQEIAAVEVRHVDLKNARWVFPKEESKGKKHPRVVYLNERALAITKQMVEKHGAGRLFRTTEGLPWTRHAIACVFGRYQLIIGHRRMKQAGVTLPLPPRFNRRTFADKDALKAARKGQEHLLYERRKALDKLARKYGTKYSLYHLRHSWATRALQRGLDPLTVSILLGHTDPSTLAKVYQHLALDPDFLRKAVEKATA